MAKQIFDVEYGPSWWECRIEIDPDFETGNEHLPTTIDAIENSVDFFDGSKDDLAQFDGDYIKTYAMQLARELCIMQVQQGLILEALIDDFKNKEGWFPIDGSWGVRVLNADDFTFSSGEFMVEEVDE